MNCDSAGVISEAPLTCVNEKQKEMPGGKSSYVHLVAGGYVGIKHLSFVGVAHGFVVRVVVLPWTLCIFTQMMLFLVRMFSL